MHALPRFGQQLSDHSPTLGRLNDRFHLEQRVRQAASGDVAGRVAGGVFGAGELALGVPYPLLLALFVALMDLIPIVGSTVAGIVVSLTALTVSVPVAVAPSASTSRTGCWRTTWWCRG